MRVTFICCIRYSFLAHIRKGLDRSCKLWDKQLLIHIVRKSTPNLTKNPSLVLIRQVLTEIQPFKTSKLTKKCMAVRKLCPTGHVFLCKL